MKKIIKDSERYVEKLELWDNLNPSLMASIERGLKQSDKGQISTHKEVMKRVRRKFDK